MSNIDWSKAPEGATHCSREGSAFHDFSNGGHRHWLCGEWVRHAYPFEAYDTPGELVARPWSGEGLPPVGAELEAGFACEDFAIWHKGVCVAVGEDPEGREEFCVVKFGNKIAMYRDEGRRMRPARTPEQIAAEERERGISQVLADFEYTVGPCTHKLARSQAERIYDAGYRKQEADK